MKFQRIIVQIIEFDAELERARINNPEVYNKKEREWLNKVLDAFIIGNIVTIDKLFKRKQAVEEKWVEYLPEKMWYVLSHYDDIKLIEENKNG